MVSDWRLRIEGNVYGRDTIPATSLSQARNDNSTDLIWPFNVEED
jgi:hypothetical protein